MFYFIYFFTTNPIFAKMARKKNWPLSVLPLDFFFSSNHSAQIEQFHVEVCANFRFGFPEARSKNFPGLSRERESERKKKRGGDHGVNRSTTKKKIAQESVLLLGM